LLLLLCSAAVLADDLPALVRDRAAIERVYYNHRLGQKPPFEQATPPALIERLVKEDLRKEVALRQVYGVAITPALLDAEVQRIDTTTRAPEMLAEIKVALGNDPAKFAQAFAKPFLVERLLRENFDNDEALHAAQRQQAEAVHNHLLKAGAAKSEGRNPKAEGSPKSEARSQQSAVVTSNLLAILKASSAGQVTETTWQLGARPAETNAPAADELEIKQRFGPNAQLISSPHGAERDRKQYFEDLPGELQRVLRVQLRQPGDVSAVIEAPSGFLLFVAKETTDTTLTVACLSLPKRGYEQWLSEQSGETK
jgi:predicted nucleic acid-binding protein